MSIDSFFKGKEFSVTKKYQKKGASVGPTEVDVKSNVLSSINKTITWLEGVDRNGRVNDISTYDNLPSEEIVGGKPKKLKKPCPKIWVEKYKDGEFVGYQWTPKSGNTNVFLMEKHCKDNQYIEGGATQQMLVESMRSIRDVLKEIPDDDFGVWANTGTYVRGDDGNIKRTDGNLKMVKKDSKGDTIKSVQFITNNTQN
jgi:hypothetical protein